MRVFQLIEVTSRNQDECMVALHDCNGDVNRAINFLLEEEVPVQVSGVSWTCPGSNVFISNFMPQCGSKKCLRSI